jgi:hypothetical protein
VAAVKSLVEAAKAKASAPDGVDAAASSLSASLPGIPHCIAQRKPLSTGGVADANVEDLEGLLPGDEFKAAQAAALLHQFLRLPALSCMRSCGDVPAHLYA